VLCIGLFSSLQGIAELSKRRLELQLTVDTGLQPGHPAGSLAQPLAVTPVSLRWMHSLCTEALVQRRISASIV
jgi:hypothetical protein